MKEGKLKVKVEVLDDVLYFTVLDISPSIIGGGDEHFVATNGVIISSQGDRVGVRSRLADTGVFGEFKYSYISEGILINLPPEDPAYGRTCEVEFTSFAEALRARGKILGAFKEWADEGYFGGGNDGNTYVF